MVVQILSAYFVVLPLRDEWGISLGLGTLPDLFAVSLLLTLLAAPTALLPRLFSEYMVVDGEDPCPWRDVGRGNCLHRWASQDLCVRIHMGVSALLLGWVAVHCLRFRDGLVSPLGWHRSNLVEFNEFEVSSVLVTTIAWDDSLSWTWHNAVNNLQSTLQKASWDLTATKALQMTKGKLRELVKIVLARCSRYITDTCIDPVEMLACLMIEGQNAYQFCIQPPDGPAFVGNSVVELQLPSFFSDYDPRAAAANLPSSVQAYLAGLTFALAASPGEEGNSHRSAGRAVLSVEGGRRGREKREVRSENTSKSRHRPKSAHEKEDKAGVLPQKKVSRVGLYGHSSGRDWDRNGVV
ncbi:hypothetical protein ABZP36_012048 [Zizania latifolia]